MAKKTDKFTYGKDDQLEIFDADGKPIKSDKGKGKSDKDKDKDKDKKKDKKAALAKFLSSNSDLVASK